MTDQLSDEQIDELKDAFNIFGKNVGFISMKDLPALLKTIGHNPAEEDTRNLFGEIDSGGTGSIDFPEFLAYVAKKQREATDDPAELIEAMNVFDKEGSGFLDRDVLEYSIRNLGDGLTESEVEEFISSIKFDSEGKISYDDFMRLVYNEKPAQ